MNVKLCVTPTGIPSYKRTQYKQICTSSFARIVCTFPIKLESHYDVVRFYLCCTNCICFPSIVFRNLVRLSLFVTAVCEEIKLVVTILLRFSFENANHSRFVQIEANVLNMVSRHKQHVIHTQVHSSIQIQTSINMVGWQITQIYRSSIWLRIFPNNHSVRNKCDWKSVVFLNLVIHFVITRKNTHISTKLWEHNASSKRIEWWREDVQIVLFKKNENT